MKLNIGETHDRLLVAKKQEDLIQKGALECKYRNPIAQAMWQYSDYIYIFAHKREIGLDEKEAIFKQDWADSILDPSYERKYNSMAEVPHFRILWQPRLLKPEPQENSWLFRANSMNDDFEVYWILPPKELWGQNKHGNMMEDPVISESIHTFLTDIKKMREPHPDDLSEERVKQIYMLICKGNKEFVPI